MQKQLQRMQQRQQIKQTAPLFTCTICLLVQSDIMRNMTWAYFVYLFRWYEYIIFLCCRTQLFTCDRVEAYLRIHYTFYRKLKIAIFDFYYCCLIISGEMNTSKKKYKEIIEVGTICILWERHQLNDIETFFDTKVVFKMKWNENSRKR